MTGRAEVRAVMLNPENGKNRKTGKKPRVMLAASASCSGKTLITCVLLQALKNRGLVPDAFKCGPDYIDPMFHRTVTGKDSRNLDSFFSDRHEIRRIISSGDGDCAVLEGVMGIYDGADMESFRGSCYEVALESETPVILIVDAARKGRTLLAEIKGILSEDQEGCIKGLILNQISASFYASLKGVLEKELKQAGFRTAVLGYLPVLSGLNLNSRHLGLVLPGEIGDLPVQMEKAAKVMEQSVDVNTILKVMNLAGVPEIGGAADDITDHAVTDTADHAVTDAADHVVTDITDHAVTDITDHAVTDTAVHAGAGSTEHFSEEDPLTLGVAYDSAFCFYYRENLDLFAKKGVKVLFFSPLRDQSIPEHVSGLLFGGGYPELHLKELSENKSMLDSVREAIGRGIPSLAECGGFMYLHDTITDAAGETYRLAGAVKGACRYTGHLVRFGYLELLSSRMQDEYYQSFVGMRGHEFHYYESTACGDSYVAGKPFKDRKWSCMVTEKNGFWGFPHFYYGSNPEAVDRFIQKMDDVRVP